MPRHKSARKRMKTNARDTGKNRAVLSQVRSAIRLVRSESEGESLAARYSRASSILDRAVRKGVVKKATASRQKSRLGKLLQAAPAQAR